MKWRFVYFPHLSSVYFPNPVLQTDSGVNNAIAKWLNRIRRVCWAAAAILEKTDAGSDWSHKKRRLCCETAIQYATDFCFSNSHATRLCVFLDPPKHAGDITLDSPIALHSWQVIYFCYLFDLHSSSGIDVWRNFSPKTYVVCISLNSKQSEDRPLQEKGQSHT